MNLGHDESYPRDRVVADEDQLRSDMECVHELFHQILYCKNVGSGRRGRLT
jgi:hypothetical protein